jgi:hypothetical protein
MQKLTRFYNTFLILPFDAEITIDPVCVVSLQYYKQFT